MLKLPVQYNIIVTAVHRDGIPPVHTYIIDTRSNCQNIITTKVNDIT